MRPYREPIRILRFAELSLIVYILFRFGGIRFKRVS